MVYQDGTLHLLEPAESHGHNLPIDFLFHSPAQGRQEQAIGMPLELDSQEPAAL